MSDRVRGLAPCGHWGTAIIGTYVRCDAGCDGPIRICAKCGSDKIREFVGFNVPTGSIHCEPCGHVMWRPGMG